MNWIEYENPNGKRIPKWMRTLGVNQDGEVFVPAAMAGTEVEVILCAAHDGMSIVQNHNHAYVSVTWVAKEFPDTKDLCAMMVERARESMP